jgi:hypothetical protein
MKSNVARTIVAAPLLFAVLVTCGTALKGKQHWSKKWGPLVPHKSFPADCELCHISKDWKTIRPDFKFDHKKETGHALNGAHNRAACLRCHNDFGPVSMYTARGCVGCHADVHRSTMGNDCLRCHTESSWRATGLVAEHARTRFPLVGRHVAAACVQCHPEAPTGTFRGAPIRCEQCHQNDLARATSIDHQAQGWTNRCEQCHTPVAWGASGFTHSFFPLTGAHKSARCEACHEGGQYGPLPRDCYSCHQDDYARAPNHTDFSRQCQQCHGTSTWRGATFNHRFRLRGEHNVDCSVCHVGGDTRTVFCFACHEHSREKMDDKHKERNGYTYSSPACVQCHPTGDD